MNAGQTVFAQLLHFFPMSEFSAGRGALRQQPPSQVPVVLRPVRSDGVCTADMARQPARHRRVPARAWAACVPFGVAGARGAQHAGRRQ